MRFSAAFLAAALLAPAAPVKAAEEADAGSATKAVAPSFEAFSGEMAATTASGLKYIDIKAGDGAEVKSGQRVSVHYAGWLKDGTLIESTYKRGRPHMFNLGRGEALKGLDEGVGGMRIGGIRRLLIPAALGFGARGAGANVPPNADLIFYVQLLGVK